MHRILLLLFIFAGCVSHAAFGQVPARPLSIFIKDVANVVTKAPTAYVRQINDTSYHVGLFSEEGRQLLGYHYVNIGGYDTGVALHDNVLFLMDISGRPSNFKVQPGYYYGIGAFARDGQLLYHPFLFDNGPDYFVEGRQRFVYNNKMGFVNRLGEVTVPARYPFVSPYKHGVAYACLDCVYKTVDSADKEHGTYFVGNDVAVIDKHGKILARQRVKHRELPHFRPLLETLSAKEKALSLLILKEPAVKRALQDQEVDTGKLKVVCFDRPSLRSPYYHFAVSDDRDDISDDLQFLISPDGLHIYHLGTYLQILETMAEWQENMDKLAKEE